MNAETRIRNVRNDDILYVFYAYLSLKETGVKIDKTSVSLYN